MACKVYSAAFTGTDGALANIVLVQDVKADLDEMYTEFASGKMTIPDLGDVFGSRASFKCTEHHVFQV